MIVIIAKKLTKGEIMAHLWLENENHKGRYRVKESLRLRKKDARDTEIAERYVPGEKIEVIAGGFELSRSAIFKIVKARDVSNRRALSAEAIQVRDGEICRRYKAGEPARDIGKIFGLDRCHVLKIIRNRKARKRI